MAKCTPCCHPIDQKLETIASMPRKSSRLLFIVFKDTVQIVCEGGRKTYKVFINWTGFRDQAIWTFDSTDDSWTEARFYTCALQEGGNAVINGLFHKLVSMVCPTSHGKIAERCYRRISFDLNEKIWKGVSCLYQVFPEKPPRPLVFDFGGLSELFVCGSKVLLVAARSKIIRYSHGDHKERTLSVFELDLDDGLAVEVSRAPIELLNRIPSVGSAACHGDCIYIPSMLYNVATRE